MANRARRELIDTGRYAKRDAFRRFREMDDVIAQHTHVIGDDSNVASFQPRRSRTA